MSQTITKELESELSQVATASGCELVHVEWRGNVLRLVIDSDGGVTHEHCSRISRQVSHLLDVEDFGPSSYTLEVTSPGLDRPIYRPEDYARFEGKLMRITERRPEGARRTLVARLDHYSPTNGGAIRVTVKDTGKTEELQLSNVTKARLEIEI